MKVFLLVLTALGTTPAFAASLRCEQTIENVVGTTAKYVEVRNSSSDVNAVGLAQDAMFKAIEEAKSSCSNDAWQCTYSWERGAGEIIKVVGIGASKIEAAKSAEVKCSEYSNCVIYASSKQVPACSKF
jgi:hypothetical protein